jgi:vitamin B12 transporter
LGFPTAANAKQSAHEVRQLFVWEEAVVSMFDGRIKSHFGVNYTDEWSSDIAPGDPVTTGDRLKSALRHGTTRRKSPAPR